MNLDGTEQSMVTIKRMVAHPLDRYLQVSSVAAIGIELPEAIRFKGMGPVWSDAEELYYYFKTGIADIDFVPLELGNINNVSGEAIQTFADVVNTEQAITYELEHSLNAENISVVFKHNDEPLMLGWKLGKIDGTDKGNFISFSTNTGYNGLSVFIIGRVVTTVNAVTPNLDSVIASLVGKTTVAEPEFNTMQLLSDSAASTLLQLPIVIEQGTVNTNFTVDVQLRTNLHLTMLQRGDVVVDFTNFDITKPCKFKLTIHRDNTPLVNTSLGFTGTDIVNTIFTNGILTAAPVALALPIKNSTASVKYVTTTVIGEIIKHPVQANKFIIIVESSNETPEWTV